MGLLARVPQGQPGAVTLVPHGHHGRDPRVPDLQAGQAHAQTGRPARLTARRRVPGLRREEVALLAGDERRVLHPAGARERTGVSESGSRRLGRALQLDEAERAHLSTSCAPRTRAPHPRAGARARTQRSGPSVQRCSTRCTSVPRLGAERPARHLATNTLGRACSRRCSRTRQRPVNFARFVFLDPRAPDFYRDWERRRPDRPSHCCAPRPAATPHDRDPQRPGRRALHPQRRVPHPWAAHDVREHRTGTKIVHHPVVGDLDLSLRSDGSHLGPRAPPARLHGRARIALT